MSGTGPRERSRGRVDGMQAQSWVGGESWLQGRQLRALVGWLRKRWKGGREAGRGAREEKRGEGGGRAMEEAFNRF